MGPDRRNLAGVALLAALFAALGDSLAVPPSALAADRSVEARNYVFVPATVTVEVGDTVTWHFSGEPHTVTSGSGPTDPRLGTAFDSGLVEPGGTFQVTFTAPGTYRYICLVHIDSGMAGTIVVQPVAAPTPTPTPTPTPRRTATPRPVSTPVPSPSPSPSPSQSPRPSAPPSPAPTPSPPAEPSPTPTLSPTTTPTPRPTVPPSSRAMPSPSTNPEPAGVPAPLDPVVGVAAVVVLLAALAAGLTRRRRRGR